MYSAEDIARGLKKARKVGDGWSACCPAHKDDSPSLSITDGNNGKILVKCHAGCTQESVIQALKSLGLWPTKIRPNTKGAPSQFKPFLKRSELENILKEVKSLADEDSSLGRKYLFSRGLRDFENVEDLKFHPKLSYFHKGLSKRIPGMVGLVRNENGKVCGVQRIYLSHEGTKAAVDIPKKALGNIGGGAVRLAEPGHELALAEGLETALAVNVATKLPTWSCISATGLEKVKIPHHVDIVRIFADKDMSGAGERSAERLARRLRTEGKEIYIHVPPNEIAKDEKGVDWLDVLTKDGLDPFIESINHTTPFEETIEAKPEFVVNGRQQSELLSEVWDRIVHSQKKSPQLFIANNSLVKVTKRAEKLRLAFINSEELREYLVRFADWISIKTDPNTKEISRSHVEVPKSLIGLMYNVPDTRLPEISLISRVPYINNKNEFVINKGYDPDSRIFLDTNIKYKNMFSTELSKSALDFHKNLLLNELLGDFPFKSHSHKINYISCLLTPFLRNRFDLAPMYIIDASTPGSGKTRLAQIFSLILFGELPPALPFSKDQAEQRKIITSMFSEGNTDLIFFDNVPSGSLNSGILAHVATQKYWSDRLLGVNKTISARNSGVWILTGNQLRPTIELIRRTPYIRLEPNSAQPWNQSPDNFKHKNILEWTKSNREKLLSSLIYLIRYWVGAGMPFSDGGPTLGSFEEWSSIMGGVFQTAELPGFLENHYNDTNLLESLEDGMSLTELFSVWWRIYKSEEVTLLELLNNPQVNGVFSELTGHFGKDALISEGGKLLKYNVGACFGSWKLHLKPGNRKSVKKYFLTPIDGGVGEQPSLEGGNNVLSI